MKKFSYGQSITKLARPLVTATVEVGLELCCLGWGCPWGVQDPHVMELNP